MAVPKKKTSPSRRGLRRAGHTHRLKKSHAMNCPSCGAPALPLHVCPECGVYKGKQVFEIKEDEAVEEETN